MGWRDFLPENSLRENAGGNERVKEIEVYAKRQWTDAYFNSRIIEL